jgi:hypothetical protein
MRSVASTRRLPASQIDGTHYISMVYIDGHPLSAFIRSARPAPSWARLGTRICNRMEDF